jgi:tRNA U34 2-thiouridine synthase MnmA/TrmU
VTVDGELAEVVFGSPQRAIAPGQTLALYVGDVVVGAGVIEKSGGL